jgi:hypothetical protein
VKTTLRQNIYNFTNIFQFCLNFIFIDAKENGNAR